MHIIALTGTATKVILEVVKMSLKNPVIIRLPPSRDNTTFKVEKLSTPDKFCQLLANEI